MKTANTRTAPDTRNRRWRSISQQIASLVAASGSKSGKEVIDAEYEGMIKDDHDRRLKTNL